MILRLGPRLSRRLRVVKRFDEVMATFWGGGDYGVQQPLTDELVREAERGRFEPPALDRSRPERSVPRTVVVSEGPDRTSSRNRSWTYSS